MLVGVYTCQNATLLEITCNSSILVFAHTMKTNTYRVSKYPWCIHFTVFRFKHNDRESFKVLYGP